MKTKCLAFSFIALFIFITGDASAQGFKEFYEKLRTIESNLDQLKVRQEKDTRLFQEQLSEVKSKQVASISDDSIERIDTRFSDLKNEMNLITTEIAKLEGDIKRLEVDMEKNGEAQVSADTMQELDRLIVSIRDKVDSMPVQEESVAPAPAENTVPQDPKVTFKPYGYLKLDMAYDQARTNNGNYTFWVNNKDPLKGNDDEFNMTARQTRIGMDIGYEGLNEWDVSAKFEFDFYGGGAENKNMPMMRKGYFKVNFGNYFLLAGQTSDVLSPLVPSTVNYIPLWNCGNIGYRHPQLQIGTSAKSGMEFVGALSRNISGDFDKDGNDDGEDNSYPTVQARLSYLKTGMNIGVSGHYGVMEYADADGKNADYQSYSVNMHASYAFSPAFSLKGEVFTGSTLNQYLGGIGQGFDYTVEREVETTGGWINAGFKPAKKTSYNLGVGIDQPKKDAEISFPDRIYNRCVFANVFTDIAYNTRLALELSHMTTGYYDAAGDETEVTNVRFQTAFILNY